MAGCSKSKRKSAGYATVRFAAGLLLKQFTLSLILYHSQRDSFNSLVFIGQQ